jgi:hypothetical protein
MPTAESFRLRTISPDGVVWADTFAGRSETSRPEFTDRATASRRKRFGTTVGQTGVGGRWPEATILINGVTAKVLLAGPLEPDHFRWEQGSLALTLLHAAVDSIWHAPHPVADEFCASRVGGDWPPTFGTLPIAALVHAITTTDRPPARKVLRVTELDAVAVRMGADSSAEAAIRYAPLTGRMRDVDRWVS